MNNNVCKRTASHLLVLLLAVLLFMVGCGGAAETADTGSNNGKPVKITYWIPKGEDSSYYDSYDENPVVKYLETLTYNGNTVDLHFLTPVAGSELDNFNTLLATEEYADLMDMSYSTVSAKELFEDGFTYDLTDYIDTYMPNYKSVLDRNPELVPSVTTLENGQRRYLGIYAINEEVLSNFKGFLYRRDWVAKYGTNPVTGAAFTYGYGTEGDPESWRDDVIFPSGGSDPVYISDWEWMFEIFQKALSDLGITDGYCLSLCFKGYNEDGALYNAFGGGAPLWYRNRDGQADFGGMDESMRTYLECMHAWYEKGWIDKAFTERTGDQVFNIDPAGVNSGKVGLWIGRRAQTGSQLDQGDAWTKGIMAYGARCPINDVYGSDAVKGQTPYSLYQYSRIQNQIVVSRKVSEENLPTVLAFIDHLYTLDGACAETFGLTKEQFETMQDPAYLRFGLTDGAYYIEKNEDGTDRYVVVDKLVQDNNLCMAMAGKRMTVGYKADGFIPALNASYPLTMQNALKEWDYYRNTGFPDSILRAGFTAEESSIYSKVHANVDTYMATQIPKFIRGTLNVLSDSDWNDYCRMLKRYGTDQVTAAYQRLYDEMN